MDGKERPIEFLVMRIDSIGRLLDFVFDIFKIYNRRAARPAMVRVMEKHDFMGVVEQSVL